MVQGLTDAETLLNRYGQATGSPSLAVHLAQTLQHSSPLVAAAGSEGTAAGGEAKRPVVAAELIAVVAATASNNRL
jgi:hypothetical protein